MGCICLDELRARLEKRTTQIGGLVLGRAPIFVAMFLVLPYLVGCGGEPPPPPPPAPPRPNFGILPVGGNTKDRIGDVVFVHGLEGNEMSTWESIAGDKRTFWPSWLSVDNPRIGVWSVWYNARISKWEGGTMAFQDRAKSLLELLRLRGIGTQKPVIFVTHSLGGIVVKQMLRTSVEGTDKRWRPLASKTRGVIFLATPHTGSNLGSYLENLATVFNVKDVSRPTVLIQQLRANAPELRDLNEWYRGKVEGLHIETRALYETEEIIPGHLVVDEGPSDPAIPGGTADPVDANHITIAKPTSREDVVYASVMDFVGRYLTPDDPWDITLPDFFKLFNKLKKDNMLEAFNHDYLGKRVRWTGIVRFVYPPRDDDVGYPPGYALAACADEGIVDIVIASFDSDTFRTSVKPGDEISITGRIARYINAGGAKLYECAWQDEEK